MKSLIVKTSNAYKAKLDENENIILVDGDDYTDNFWTDFCYIFEDGLLDDEGNIVHITEQDDIIE